LNGNASSTSRAILEAALHLLEKLVEWKLCPLKAEVMVLTETLHLLEKLVEWKHVLHYGVVTIIAG